MASSEAPSRSRIIERSWAWRAAAIGWSLAGCQLPIQTAPVPTAPQAPGLLLITVEGAPATTFAPWGGPDARLDPIAAQGVTWSRAYAPSPQLQPNLATVLTGRPPAEHGMRVDNAQLLPAGATTLFEELEALGWKTGSSSGTLSTDERWGLHQGIEQRITHREASTRDLPAEWVLSHLQATDDAAWVHIPSDGLALLSEAVAPWRATHPAGWLVVVGVTGKGQGLKLDDDALRLPLIVVGPGYPAGTVLHDVVGLVDIAPTMRSHLGLPTSRIPLLDGGSILVDHEAHAGRAAFGAATLFGQTEEEGRFVVGQYATWYGALGPRIPPTGHVVTESHAGAQRFRNRQAQQVRVVPEMAWIPHSERLSLAFETPLSLGDPDAPPGPIDPRDLGGDVALLEGAVEALRQRRYVDALRLSADLGSTPAGLHVRALTARAQGAFADAASILEQGHATSVGASWAWHRAELEVDRCQPSRASAWLTIALERTAPHADALSIAHRALGLGPLPVALKATAEDLVTIDPVHPLAISFIDPTNTTLLSVRPTSATYAGIRARAAWQRGHVAQAMDHQRKAVTLDPTSCPPRAMLAQWLLETGDPLAANRLLAPLNRVAPEDPRLRALWKRAQLTDEQRHDRRADRIHNRP